MGKGIWDSPVIQGALATYTAQQQALADLAADPFTIFYDAIRSRSYMDDVHSHQGYRATYMLGARGLAGDPWAVETPPDPGLTEHPSWIQVGANRMPAPPPFRPAPPPYSGTPIVGTGQPRPTGTVSMEDNDQTEMPTIGTGGISRRGPAQRAR